MKLTVIIFFMVMITLSMANNINYNNVLKTLHLSPTQVSSAMEIINIYKGKLIEIDNQSTNIENQILEFVSVRRNPQNLISIYKNLLTQKSTTIKEFEKKVCNLLNSNQKDLLNRFIKKLYKNSSFDLNLDSVYLGIQKYLGIQNTLTTDLPKNTNIIVREMILKSLTIDQAIEIKNLISQKMQKLDDLSFLQNNLLKTYQQTINDGNPSEKIKEKLDSAIKDKKNIISNTFENLKTIIGLKKYRGMILEYKNEVKDSVIENLIFDKNLVKALKNINKSP